MKENHITSLLDEKGYQGLNVAERAAAEDHCRACRECARALRAAHVAEDLLTARANVTIDPAPFFMQRVMANVRAQKSQPEPALLVRLWLASRFVVTAMLAIVMVLFALNWRAVEAPTIPANNIATVTAEPGDVFLIYDGNSSSDDTLTDSQVLTAVFGLGDGYGNKKQK